VNPVDPAESDAEGGVDSRARWVYLKIRTRDFRPDPAAHDVCAESEATVDGGSRGESREVRRPKGDTDRGDDPGEDRGESPHERTKDGTHRKAGYENDDEDDVGDLCGLVRRLGFAHIVGVTSYAVAELDAHLSGLA
jgi:hypothetical protein